MNTLRLHSSGPEVKALQNLLKEAGFNPGPMDGEFGPGTEQAVKAFQKSEGLLDDGIAGPRTISALTPEQPVESVSILPAVTSAIVSRMFPHTPIANIEKYLPSVRNGLEKAGLVGQGMVLVALATIRAETEGFRPISEYRSKYNTSPGGHPFDLYHNRKDLGNQGPPDGERFKGRGFIQLTGRNNYAVHGNAIGEDLVNQPDKANDPDIASRLLASFLADKEVRIKKELLEGDLRGARRLVNGGSHGLERFTSAFEIGKELIPETLAV